MQSCFSTINVPLKWQVNLGFKAPKLIGKTILCWWGACSPLLFIDFNNQYSSKMAISSLQLQKKWKTILDWSGLRKRSCRHMSFSPLMFVSKGANCSFCEKEHIFFQSTWNNLIRFSSVQMTGMLHFDGSGFPGASLHIVRTSIFWQNRYFIFRSQSKNVHESPILAIFSSVVICLWYKQTCQSQSSVRLGMLE